jgi:hypothetical protein
VQGDDAPAGQQSLVDAASEQAKAGEATPRRLTQMTAHAVNRRITGSNSNFRSDGSVKLGDGAQ